MHIYQLFREGPYVMKKFRYAKLKEVKEHLKINGSTRLIGTTPDYIGFRPSKPVASRNFVLESLHKTRHNLMPDFVESAFADTIASPKDVWGGGYDTNSYHLSQFFNTKDDKGKISVEEILSIVEGCPWFKVPHIDFNSPDEMYTMTNFNPNSDPGHYTKILTQQVKKRFTVTQAYGMALELYHRIIEKPTKNFCLWDVLAREKEIKINSDKIPSTRVVLNPEHHVTILLSWIFQKFLKACQKFNPEVRFLIDGEFDGSKAKKLMDQIVDKYPIIIDADWSLFDASQEKEYLIAAICIMFSNLEDNDMNKRLVYYIIEATVCKYIAVPPGLVVECNRGMPSGHPGVTAINCFVNLIRWAIIGKEIYGENYWEMMDLTVYGDDALVGFTPDPNLWKIDEICKDYGFKGDPISSNFFINEGFITDPHNSPDFLKRRFNLSGVFWNHNKVMDRLVYQTKNRPIDEQIELVLGYIETAPSNWEFTLYLINLINDMVKRNRSMVSDGIINKLKNFSFDFLDKFNIYHSKSALIGLDELLTAATAYGQVYLPNMPKTIDTLGLNYIMGDFKMEMYLLYKFTNNDELFRKDFCDVKFFLFDFIFKKYFKLVKGYLIPRVEFLPGNNLKYVNTS